MAEMLADVAEAKALCEDGSEAIKAKSMAAVADARASYSNTLIKLEHMIEARLGRLRKLIDDKSGPRVDDVEGKVHYEGELVTHDGSIYQALRDTGRAPLHEEDWICIGAGGRDGRSFAVRGTYRPEEKNYRAFDIVALNGGSFVARRDNPGVLTCELASCAQFGASCCRSATMV